MLNDVVDKKGGKLLVSFPGYQATSFDINQKEINLVYQKLQSSRLVVIGNPNKYKMNDTLMFNTKYHLTKFGVDRRTELLISDLKGSLR
jgi:hypothetical protein